MIIVRSGLLRCMEDVFVREQYQFEPSSRKFEGALRVNVNGADEAVLRLAVSGKHILLRGPGACLYMWWIAVAAP